MRRSRLTLGGAVAVAFAFLLLAAVPSAAQAGEATLFNVTGRGWGHGIADGDQHGRTVDRPDTTGLSAPSIARTRCEWHLGCDGDRVVRTGGTDGVALPPRALEIKANIGSSLTTFDGQCLVLAQMKVSKCWTYKARKGGKVDGNAWSWMVVVHSL